MAKRILVAENDKLNMRLFHDVLSHRGYETIEVEDGAAALASARDSHPDLILTDVQLPGLSGIELTGRLKADPALARIPVVAVTAFIGKADEARIRASGVDDFITKPVAPSRLIAAVERNLPRTANGNGHAALKAEEVWKKPASAEGQEEEREAPQSPLWTIVADFAKRSAESPPTAEPTPEPAPQAAPTPAARAADASHLLGTALAFTGAFLAVALSPTAGGLEGLSDLYVVHFPNGAESLCPGRAVLWEGEAVGRVVRVDLDRELAGAVRAVLRLDRLPEGLEEMTAVLRHETTSGDAYVELRPGTVASVRLYAHVNRAATSLRPVRTEIAREIEDLPRWFRRAAATVEGAAASLDRRDTLALSHALTRIAALMKTAGEGAQGLDPKTRQDWVEDISQLLAEARDLFGLLRQMAERMGTDSKS